MKLLAPAKINLYLRIVGKRDDGYHEIETLFERVSIYDSLTVEITPELTVITCDAPGVPTDEKSLLMRAIKAFKEKTGYSGHFAVNLLKTIPIGGGLGGGSSDVATLLLGINEVSGVHLKKDELMDIGRSLGADIPFFLGGTSFAFGTGRGDVIKELKGQAKFWHILVTPPFEIYTKDVYSQIAHFALTKNRGVDTMFTAFLDNNDISGIARNLRNDLQTIVLREFPVLKQTMDELVVSGAEGTLLSGSGSTVFGIFREKDVLSAYRRVCNVFREEEGWRVFTATTC